MKVDELKLFDFQNVYFCYDLESVMFRWDFSAKKAYIKFYGEAESPYPVSLESRIYTDSLLYGDLISKDQYERGLL